MSGIGGFGATSSAYGLPTDPELEVEAGAAADSGQAAPAPASAPGQSAEAPPSGSAMSIWQAIQGDTATSLFADELCASLNEPAAESVAMPEVSQSATFAELDSIGQELDALTDELIDLSIGTSAIDGMSLDEIQARIAEIESELAFLYDYEALLLSELESPDVGFLDSFWIEWDLWDTEFSIEDLECELASLEGEVYDREFDSLWEEFWGGFGQTIDLWVGFFDQSFESEQDFQAQKEDTASQRQLLEAVRQRLDDADTIRRLSDQKNDDARDAVKALAAGRPAFTPEVRAALAATRPLVDALLAEPSREALDRVREAIQAIRGRTGAA